MKGGTWTRAGAEREAVFEAAEGGLEPADGAGGPAEVGDAGGGHDESARLAAVRPVVPHAQLVAQLVRQCQASQMQSQSQSRCQGQARGGTGELGGALADLDEGAGSVGRAEARNLAHAHLLAAKARVPGKAPQLWSTRTPEGGPGEPGEEYGMEVGDGVGVAEAMVVVEEGGGSAQLGRLPLPNHVPLNDAKLDLQSWPDCD